MFYFDADAYQKLNNYIDNQDISSIIVIDDEHTHDFCLPVFKDKINFSFKVITIKAGDKHKNLETLQYIWNKLIEFNADRNSLIINLGGGVITDIGGFAASTFKRGVKFIHIPTTLLSMVDASIGGKNGINFGGAKNQIGNINLPEMILIDKYFLKTLPQNELLSGFAEMLKHGLIADANYWYELIENKVLQENILNDNFSQLIERSIQIKNSIVKQDPYEKGIRKTLNFGHTLGHAIESYSYQTNNILTHGHAVAIGMILAAHLSYQNNLLEFTNVNRIKNVLTDIYNIPSYNSSNISQIIDYLKYDKKNIGGKTRFVLLKAIGTPIINQFIETEHIKKAFEYLND